MNRRLAEAQEAYGKLSSHRADSLKLEQKALGAESAPDRSGSNRRYWGSAAPSGHLPTHSNHSLPAAWGGL